ncbi:MAG: rod-binding protein [Bacteriovoracaceae bacterium]|nr:rod-binding protein [Bacteriovoracaceae bacterium]
MKTKGIDLNIQKSQSNSHGLNLKDAKKVIQDDTRFIPEPYKKVASGFEQEFARFMIDQMEKTVPSESPDSQATSYYKSITTAERAKTMAETGEGLGLKGMILDQIYPKYKRTELGYNSYKAQLAAQNQAKNKIKLYQNEQQNGVSGIQMTPKSQQGESNE